MNYTEVATNGGRNATYPVASFEVEHDWISYDRSSNRKDSVSFEGACRAVCPSIRDTQHPTILVDVDAPSKTHTNLDTFAPSLEAFSIDMCRFKFV